MLFIELIFFGRFLFYLSGLNILWNNCFKFIFINLFILLFIILNIFDFFIILLEGLVVCRRWFRFYIRMISIGCF